MSAYDRYTFATQYVTINEFVRDPTFFRNRDMLPLGWVPVRTTGIIGRIKGVLAEPANPKTTFIVPEGGYHKWCRAHICHVEPHVELIKFASDGYTLKRDRKFIKGSILEHPNSGWRPDPCFDPDPSVLDELTRGERREDSFMPAPSRRRQRHSRTSPKTGSISSDVMREAWWLRPSIEVGTPFIASSSSESGAPRYKPNGHPFPPDRSRCPFGLDAWFHV